jgi:hypothetical protein
VDQTPGLATLEAVDQSGIGSDPLAGVAFGQGDAEAVVDTAALTGKLRRVHREFHPQLCRVADDSPPPAFRKGVSGFQRERVGGNQVVNPTAEFVSELACFGGIDLVHHPLDRDGRIEDTFHSSSRTSRIKSTAILVTPCFSSIAHRTCSDRSVDAL